jgi:hypothetical protein
MRIRLGLLAKVRLDDACAPSTDALRVGERDLERVAARVLVDRHQRRDAAALLVVGAHRVPRSLGRHHEDVHALGRMDHAEVDVEAVGDRQVVAGLQVRLHVFAVDGRGALVGERHHHDVGLARGLGRSEDPQPGRLGLGPGRRFLAQPHHDVDTGRREVLGVGVALAAIAEHRDGATLEPPQIGILVVVDLQCHRVCISWWASWAGCASRARARRGARRVNADRRAQAGSERRAAGEITQ